MWELTWLDEFRAAYINLPENTSHAPPRLDKLAVHCYSENLYDDCRAVVDWAIQRCGQWDGCTGVWLTELGWLWNPPEQWEVCALIEWLNQREGLERWFWFTSWIKDDGSEWWWPDFVPWKNTWADNPNVCDYGTGDLSLVGEIVAGCDG